MAGEAVVSINPGFVMDKRASGDTLQENAHMSADMGPLLH
jgi:hypothetical protein